MEDCEWQKKKNGKGKQQGKRSENDEYKNIIYIYTNENNWKKWVWISEINKERKTNNTDVKKVFLLFFSSLSFLFRFFFFFCSINKERVY